MTSKCMISGTESSIFRLNILHMSTCILSVRKCTSRCSPWLSPPPFCRFSSPVRRRSSWTPQTCSQFPLWTGSQAWFPALSPQNPTELIWPDRGRGEWWKPGAVVAQLGSTSPGHIPSCSESGEKLLCCLTTTALVPEGHVFTQAGWWSLCWRQVIPVGSQLHLEIAATPPLAALGFAGALLLSRDCFTQAWRGKWFLSFPQQLKVGSENLCSKYRWSLRFLPSASHPGFSWHLKGYCPGGSYHVFNGHFKWEQIQE